MTGFLIRILDKLIIIATGILRAEDVASELGSVERKLNAPTVCMTYVV